MNLLIWIMKRAVLFLVLPLALIACGGSGSSSSNDDTSLSNDTPFLYVERSIQTQSNTNLEKYRSTVLSLKSAPVDYTSPYDFNPGAKLINRSSLDVDAIDTDVLTEYFQSTQFDVKDLSVSVDGNTVLFAAHGPSGNIHHSTWSIYEYNFNTQTIRRIIKDDLLANAGQDTNPAYATDGNIIFSSNREAGNPNSPIPNVIEEELEENCYKVGPEEDPSLLHSMSAIGTDILQLTYGSNHDITPTTLKDGRIAFVRWSRSYELLPNCDTSSVNRNVSKSGFEDIFKASYPSGMHMPANWSSEDICQYSQSTPIGSVIASNHYTLLRINQEGTELEQLYETVTASGSDEGFIRISKIVQAENGHLIAVIQHHYNQFLGGNVLELQSPESVTNTTVFGNLAPRSLINGGVNLYPNQLSVRGWYSAVSPYWDGSSRILVSWAQCSVVEDGVNSFCEADTVIDVKGDVESKYGIWVFDPEKDSRLPIVRAKDDTVYSELAMSQTHVGLGFPFQPYNPDYVDNEDQNRIVCRDPDPVCEHGGEYPNCNPAPTCEFGGEYPNCNPAPTCEFGGEYPNCNPAPTCEFGGVYPNCNPAPTCEFGGEYPNCNPAPICEFGGEYPNCNPAPICEFGGVYPNCNPAPTCEFGGEYPNCNPAPICEFGGEYPDCNPAPTCEFGGEYPNCNPEPTCEFGGEYPNCNPAPTCEFGGEYPDCNPAPTCEFGGEYPDCNPAPTCEFGGEYPDCNPAPTCEFGGEYPDCNPAPTCEFGGEYPDCNPAPTCEFGGEYPDCNPAPTCEFGGEYPDCNPAPTCEFGGEYPNCNPEPTCEFGGEYPNCNPEPTCEFGGEYPNCNPAPTCEFGGEYPDCNPAPTCEFGGEYPDCNPAPTCEFGGEYPNCNPAPTCEFGGEYPDCNPAPTCEFGGEYPDCNPAPTCEFGGEYPDCNPAPTCEFGGEYPDCNPAPTCEFGGEYPNCNPEPTCEFGGEYPDCNPAPTCEFGGEYPNCTLGPICEHGGVYPNCNPAPTCEFGGEYPNCNPAPTCEFGGVYPNCTLGPICEHGGEYPNCNPAPTCEFGGEYPNCNPAPTCEFGGEYPNCNPEPTCEFGGEYPNCNPEPTCEFGGEYPNCNPEPTCEFGGEYPNCNPEPTCEFGGEYPNCNPAPTCEFGGEYPNCNPAPTCEFGGEYPNCNPEPTCEFGGVYPDCEEPNSAPIADAGEDQTALTSNTVTLNGSDSSDADGDTLLYQWNLISQPESSNSLLLDAVSVSPSFVPDIAGSYVIELKVNDGNLTSEGDIVTVVAETSNAAPIANAGEDITAEVAVSVSLDGSASYDPNGDLLNYSWTLISQPEGSGIELTSTDVVASIVPDIAGVYIAQLVVNDGQLDSNADTVTITAEIVNRAPTANAGPDQNGSAGDMAILDASASFDPDGDLITYVWSLVSQPEGSVASISDPVAEQASIETDIEGTYVIELVANDGEFDSTPDTLTITVTPPNIKPVADAGSDQSTLIGDQVNLNGSGSYDQDGDSLTYHWSVISPVSASGALSDSSSVTPSLIIEEHGLYVIQLIVNDGGLDSDPDTVYLKAGNTKPIANAGEDKTGWPGDTLELNGSASSDLDGDPLSYQWRIVDKPIGSQVSLSDSSAVMPSLTLDMYGEYRVQLIVNDDYEDSDPDTLTISSVNAAPIANAGADRGVCVNEFVSLSGSGSSDAEGDPLSYQWSLISQPETSAAILSGADQVSPNIRIDVAGNYVVQLVVNDGVNSSEPDTVLISTLNTSPIANAGADQTTESGRQVNLDGSRSYDPDGSNVSYRWSLIRQPEGSNLILANGGTSRPNLEPTEAGTYIVQLIVSDGVLDSAPDTVMIEVEESLCSVSTNTRRSFPVTIRDFDDATHPDFEYVVAEDYGIVQDQLGEDGLPVYANYTGTPTTNGPSWFYKWYRTLSGWNIEIPIALEMIREEGSTVWEYQNNSFFPIDGMGYGNTPGWQHNYHFTLEAHLEFDYQGGEEFTFRGDDDLWVFINGKLAIDIGGVHPIIERSINLDEMAEQLGIVRGNTYRFDLFFAERHTVASNFMFQTSINLECTVPR